MFEKYVIVRGDRSGVFAGTFVSREGREVVLRDVRRLWRWDGATECIQLAAEGVKNPDGCKFTMTVPSIMILDAIEIHPASEKAEASIKGVPEWKM